ncbi:MAG: hypothetical protein ABI625_17790, partial [bacterium]
MHNFVGIRGLTVAAIGGMVLLGACHKDDARVQKVDTGMTKQAVLTEIGKNGPPGADSLPNVYDRERYLIDSKNYEVLFFSPTGKHKNIGVEKDTIPWKDLTPIAM